MNAKSLKRVYIGYREEFKAYKCLDPETRKVQVSKEITFFEEKAGIVETLLTRIHQTVLLY